MTHQEEEARRSSGVTPAALVHPMAASSNFAYLGYHDPRLVGAATRAERVLGLDPLAALGHLRLFGQPPPGCIDG
jgi:hypothetical protein